MKQPVLKIKKGAIVYDDAEAIRKSELPRPALPGTGPLVSRRRKRRGGRLTYFPLLVIALGLFILFRIVPSTPANRATLSGWQVTLRVTPFKDTLIVGVTFISSSTGTTQGPRGGGAVPEATVRFSLPGTGEQVFVAGDLEKSPMTLRGQLPYLENAKKVQAEVGIGNAHATLRISTPAPQSAPSPSP